MQIRLTSDRSPHKKNVLSIGSNSKTENHIDIVNSPGGGHIDICASDGTKINCHFKGSTDLFLDLPNLTGKFESVGLNNTNQLALMHQNPQSVPIRPCLPPTYPQLPAARADMPTAYMQQPGTTMEKGYEMWQNRAAFQNGTAASGTFSSVQDAVISDIAELKIGKKGKEKFSTVKASEKKGKIGKFISTALFYGLLICLVGGAFLISQGSKKPVFGYYFMNVLTWSMQSEIPQGSMIVVRQVDPTTIKIGDDITYMKDAETSVTHRVIGITENFQGSGEKGFETQGIENDSPDFDIIPAVNVMGVVKFHIPMVGSWLEWLRGHLAIAIIFTAGFILLLVLIKGAFQKDPEERKTNPLPSR